MELKIGRHKYDITKEDEFMDNGACIQLLTQSKEKSSWGRRANPVLSKRAIKEISKYARIDVPNNYQTNVNVFSLDIKD